jgi:hypothetical protein
MAALAIASFISGLFRICEWQRNGPSAGVTGADKFMPVLIGMIHDVGLQSAAAINICVKSGLF